MSTVDSIILYSYFIFMMLMSLLNQQYKIMQTLDKIVLPMLRKCGREERTQRNK